MDGAKVWEFAADGPVVASPLILGDRVYIGSAGTNWSVLDRGTGKEVWRYGLEAEIKSSAGWFRSPRGPGHWLVFGGVRQPSALPGRRHGPDQLGLRDLELRQRRSRRGRRGNRVRRVRRHCARAAAGGRHRGKQVEAGAYIIGSAAVLDGVAYIGHYENEFLAVDLRKGEVVWRYRDRNFPYGGSPR